MSTLTKASLYFVSLQVDFVMVQDMRAARESEKVGNRSNEKGQGHHISTPRKRTVSYTHLTLPTTPYV